MIPGIIQGIQSQGVMANVKHYVNNNQENDRFGVNEVVDERTRWEIYLPPFEAAVKAGVLSAMCSYNRITPSDVTDVGDWSCENHETLAVDLKQRLGFEGFVMSDWGATHSAVKAANNGLDQEMPGEDWFGDNLVAAVEAGDVTTDTIDDKVMRILTAMFSIGLFDDALKPEFGNLTNNVTTETNVGLARTIAANATVLLTNNGVLPLSLPPSDCSLVVLGSAGNDAPITAGGGSGYVAGSYVVSPFAGIAARAGDDCEVAYYANLGSAEAVSTTAEVVVCARARAWAFGYACVMSGGGKNTPTAPGWPHTHLPPPPTRHRLRR